MVEAFGLGCFDDGRRRRRYTKYHTLMEAKNLNNNTISWWTQKVSSSTSAKRKKGSGVFSGREKKFNYKRGLRIWPLSDAHILSSVFARNLFFP